jgi:hypothetical protein
MTDAPDHSFDADSSPGDVTVSTTPVPLTLRPFEDERVPAGQTGISAFLGDRVIARNTFPTEFIERIPLDRIFEAPVPLIFHATESGPGIQGTLYAVVPAELLEPAEEEPEPWAVSLPRYEDAIVDEEAGDAGDFQAMFPLGVLVRVRRDRKFPRDLALEAGDLLHTVLTGRTHEPIDRVLDDLLNS